MPSFQVLVLGLLFVSFRPSLIRSHSCSSGASLLFRFRFSSGLSASLPVSFVPFRSASSYSASVFPFLFFLFPPHSGFLSAPLPLSLLRFSPFFPAWFPMLSFPVLRTRLSVCFLSSFPVSLPQLFHWCFPSFPLSLLFRAFPFPSGFFRPLLFRF